MSKLKILPGKTFWVPFVVLSLIVLTFPFLVNAFEIKTGNSIYINKDETVSGNLYSASKNITIDGKIEGDVICASNNITVNGEVAGDIICASQNININGELAGDLRLAGENVTINGQVEKNASVMCSKLNIGQEGKVGWDILVLGQTASVQGEVGRNIHGILSQIDVQGKIKENINLKLAPNKEKDFIPITVSENAVIGKNIRYTAGKKGVIPDNAVAGEIQHQFPKTEWDFWSWGWKKIYSIFSAFIIGLILITLFKKQTLEITENIINKPVPSVLWGVAVMFLTPIIAFVLMVTFIGLPLALMLGALWLIAMFLSKVIVGIAVGLKIIKKKENKEKNLMLAMIMGIVLVYLVLSIPVIGFVLSIITIWLGLGGIWLSLKKSINN